MKKSLLVLLLTLFWVVIYSQEKKKQDYNFKFNIFAGSGVGAYHGTSNLDSTEEDLINAACMLINIQADYIVFKRFAAGVIVERNGFLTARDSSDRAYSLNIGISARYKFVDRDFNTFFAEILPAFSYFTYQKLNSTQEYDIVESNGFGFHTGIGWNHYFNTHLGMFISTCFPVYWYNTIINTSTGEILTINNPSEDLNIRFSGLNIKLGVAYRF